MRQRIFLVLLVVLAALVVWWNVSMLGGYWGTFYVLLTDSLHAARSEAPMEQGHTEAAKDQTRSEPCERTRIIYRDISSESGGLFITNDVRGCPKGGLLSGTDQPDNFAGKDGQDEIRGLGGSDQIEGGLGKDEVYGGSGNDTLGAKFVWTEDPPPEPPKDLSKNVVYGGSGDDLIVGANGDDVLYGAEGDDELFGEDDESRGWGEDTLYGGPGNDTLWPASDGQRDKLYCGEGNDRYVNTGDKIDYVDSSCEIKKSPPGPLE